MSGSDLGVIGPGCRRVTRLSGRHSRATTSAGRETAGFSLQAPHHLVESRSNHWGLPGAPPAKPVPRAWPPGARGALQRPRLLLLRPVPPSHHRWCRQARCPRTTAGPAAAAPT